MHIYILLIFLAPTPPLQYMYKPIWLPPQILSYIGTPNPRPHDAPQCTMGPWVSCKKHFTKWTISLLGGVKKTQSAKTKMPL